MRLAALLLGFVLAGWDYAAVAAEPKAAIQCPERVAQCSFIVRAAGSAFDEPGGFQWIHPFQEFIDSVDRGSGLPTLLIANPPLGKHQISVVTAGVVDGEVRLAIATETVVVGEPEPEPPEPEPPAPDPLPDGEFGVARKARGWSRAVNRPTEAKALSGEFAAVAAKIAAGALSGPTAIMNDVRRRTGSVLPAASRPLWEPFTAGLAAELSRLFEAGRLGENDAWANCFREVALGLGA